MYFPIEAVTDAEKYVAIKKAIHMAFPFFDDNALDAARLIFGSDCDEVAWHDGWMNIDEEIVIDMEEELPTAVGPIMEGNRNNTLSRFAGRVLKRYGEGDKAHQIFLEEAEKCDPPLDDSELNTIWFSALKFFRTKVKTQDGYVAPDSYNDDFETKSLKPSDYSDIGQAKALKDEYGEELLFTNATDYLRFDGDCWAENKQLAVGAVEEFLDLQLADAIDEMESTKKALIDSGVAEEDLAGNGKKAEKGLEGDQIALYFKFMAAKQYYAFVMKHRDYKYITCYGLPLVAMVTFMILYNQQIR